MPKYAKVELIDIPERTKYPSIPLPSTSRAKLLTTTNLSLYSTMQMQMRLEIPPN